MFIVPLNYKQPLVFCEDSSRSDNVCLFACKKGAIDTHGCLEFNWQWQGFEVTYTCLIDFPL